MSASTPDLPQPLPLRRIDLVDLARGLALLAMFVFHFAYDLSFFGLIATDVPADPAWRWFARAIAASFLTLVGVSLVLATQGGLNRRSYLKRLAMVAGAAALVTLGTRLAMPQSFIFFGILHHVALASVLALPFLRLPGLGLVLAAVLVFALPHLVAPPWLDRPWLSWLGFAQEIPSTADFVPVFPWFGWVLAGMALARFAVPRLAGSRAAFWRATSPPARLVVWGGRNSLIVYLLHQPLFIGAILAFMQLAAPAPSEERSFMLSCQRSCAGGSADADACERLCACTVDALKAASLWRRTLDDALPPADRQRVTELAQACNRPSGGRP